MKIDCTTCKYGYKDERLGIPMCHHPKRFSEDCVNFNMHEEKEIKESEKPINLEEEINRYLREECSDDDEPGIHEIAEHFAKWGYLRAAEKFDEIEYNRQRTEESAPNDLEEAASEYSTNEADRVYGKPDPHDYTDHSGCGAAHDNYEVGLQVGFKAGAKWQIEQFQELLWMLMRPKGGWGKDKDNNVKED